MGQPSVERPSLCLPLTDSISVPTGRLRPGCLKAHWVDLVPSPKVIGGLTCTTTHQQKKARGQMQATGQKVIEMFGYMLAVCGE